MPPELHHGTGCPSQARKAPLVAAVPTLQHVDQAGGSLLRREQVRGGHGAPERCRQLRRGGAGMEQGHAGQGQPPSPLDGQGEQQLVLGCLRRPVGVPATEPVVGDASHPGRQAGEVHRQLLRQGRFDGLSQQQGPIGIDRETSFQGRTADLAEALLRLQVTVVEQTRRIDHDPQGGQFTDGSVRQPGQAGIVGKVEGEVTAAPPADPDAQARCTPSQLGREGGSDPAWTDDQGLTFPGRPGLGGGRRHGWQRDGA